MVEAPTPRRERGRGKTDAMDAVTAARKTLTMPVIRLRDRPGGQDQVALQVLTTAREQLNAERLRAVNALTALVRAHDLGIDARRALANAQTRQTGSWRRRSEPVGLATARAEGSSAGRPYRAARRRAEEQPRPLTAIVTDRAPELLAMPGFGAVAAAVVLCVWSPPGRVRSEAAAMGQIAGTSPIPASSGNTVRHRLNRGGDRRLNLALNAVVLTRMRTDPNTRAYVARRTAEGKTGGEIRRSSSATSPARSTGLTTPPLLPNYPLQRLDST